METRANHIWVGAVTLLLLVGALALALWIARLSERDQRDYDIFFKQSVDGLAKGSGVSFSGVPAGQVREIALWDKDPEYVRVRIAIDSKVPILQGTTASLQGNFTGVSTITLGGAARGAPPIDQPGRDGVPEIPTRRSGLGELLSNAPVLLSRLTAVADRLASVLSDKNQKSVESILAHTDRLTGTLADAAPQVKTTLADLDVAIVQAKDTLASLQHAAGAVDATMSDPGNGVIPKLRDAIASVQGAADSIRNTVDAAKPGVERFNTRTLPETEAALRDLAAATRSLRALTDQIHERGLVGMVSGPSLPDYKGH